MSNDLEAIAERIVGSAQPGEAVEAYLTTGRETSVRVMDGAVESLTTATSAAVAVRIIRDHRQGIAVAATLDPEVLEETISDARDCATYGAPDPFVRLSTPEDVGSEAPSSLDVWNEDVLTTATAEKVALALELDGRTRARDPRVARVEAADYGDGVSETVVLNSNGIAVRRKRSTTGLSVVALADEGEVAYSGYGFSVRRSFAELDVEEAVTRAVARAAALLGARPIPTTRMPVMFDNMAARSFVGLLGGMVNGESVVRGRALFADRVGEVIASPVVSLVEDPRNTASFSAATTDAEGIPTRAVSLIESGVLQGFLHNLYTGARSGHGTTASATRGLSRPPGVGVRALSLAPGSQSPESLLAEVGTCLLVESISGLHSGTNTVTGDFSVGVQGHMVRNGVISEPVREVTIASTIPKMLLDLVAVGNDTLWLSGSTAGNSLLFSEMAVSGT